MTNVNNNTTFTWGGNVVPGQREVRRTLLPQNTHPLAISVLELNPNNLPLSQQSRTYTRQSPHNQIPLPPGFRPVRSAGNEMTIGVQERREALYSMEQERREALHRRSASSQNERHVLPGGDRRPDR